MKIIHIESGLGNQMLSYCEYLAARQSNPDDLCVLETIIYDIPECHEVICQWQGYELHKIFGVNAPNISDYINPCDWETVITMIRNSRFWDKNWNYPVYFVQAFNAIGMQVENVLGDFEKYKYSKTSSSSSVDFYKSSYLYQAVKRLYHRLSFERRRNERQAVQDLLFCKDSRNLFTGQRLTFKKRGAGIERIHREITESFRFPDFTDEANRSLAHELRSVESVAIHARRGDMLTVNKKYYTTGYFKRAVSAIKSRISSPNFYFFTDPGSISWCRENARTFGLDYSKDIVKFVDWNKGEESYRDMQLMSICRHNIITNSSFGWWGAYLNENPGKMTISPEIEILTTHHF